MDFSDRTTGAYVRIDNPIMLATMVIPDGRYKLQLLIPLRILFPIARQRKSRETRSQWHLNHLDRLVRSISIGYPFSNSLVATSYWLGKEQKYLNNCNRDAICLNEVSNF